jgi:hypothetical protein
MRSQDAPDTTEGGRRPSSTPSVSRCRRTRMGGEDATQGDYVGCAGRRAHHEMASPMRNWPAQVRMALIVGSLRSRPRCHC